MNHVSKLIYPRSKQGPWAVVGFLVIYIAARWASAQFLPIESGLDLSAAIGVAFLFFVDLRWWPLVAVGALVGDLFMQFSAIAIAANVISQTAQAVVGTFVLRRFAVDPIYRRRTDALTTIGAAILTSIVPLFVLYAAAFVSQTPTLEPSFDFYLGRFFSIIVILPFTLRWYAKPLFARGWRESIETLLAFCALFGIASVIYVGGIHEVEGVPLEYILALPLLWISFRMRPRFVTLGLLLVSGLAMFEALVVGSTETALFQQETVLTAFAIMFLIIASQEEDRRTSRNVMRSQLSTLENALERIRGEAKAREEFIAVLAHELRNPLAPIVSNIELLKLKGPRDEEEADALAVMESRMSSIRRLLEDLLDVSRVIEGKVRLETKPIDLNEVIRAAVLSVEHFRFERHQRIEVEYPPSPLWVVGDRVRLEQVFSNLLSNACKYSSAGDTIRLNAQRIGESAVITVADTGVGLTPDSYEKIFLPFEQVYKGKRKIDGLGIGLALVKNFITLHKGTIQVQSSGLGEGSTFTITLPLSEAASQSDEPAVDKATPQVQGSKKPLILIVDDNDVAAGALGRLLEIIGYRVSYAYSGPQAYKTALEQVPDVTLLDINMPGANGYEVAQAMRDMGYKGSIIAVSGYGPKDAASLYGDTAVFNHYLVKPIGVTELRSVLPAL